MTTEHEKFLDNATMLLLGASTVISQASRSLEGDVELKSVADILVSAHLYMSEKIRTLTTPLLPTADANEYKRRMRDLAADCRHAADVLALNAR